MANNNGHKNQAKSHGGVGFASEPSMAVNEAPPVSAPLEKSEELSASPPVEELRSQGTVEHKDLNKIRDILFGQQVQTHEHRFEQLERKIENESNHLRAHIQRQVATLEDRLIEHVDRLSGQIKAEAGDRQSADDRLNQSLLDKEAELTRRATGTDKKIAENQQAMLAELRHEITTLRSSLDVQLGDLLANLEQETASRVLNIDRERKKLSGLFSQMAQQLEGKT